MNARLSPIGFVFAATMSLLTLLSASLVVPHDRYFRWQAYHNGTTRKADWIFERLHFDPTRIDVALIGTSRMGGSLSARDIEAAYCEATGRSIKIANLSIPETGRNMHYVIAKETARAKRPPLVVVELNEEEPRRPHNGFIALADLEDVLGAPLIVNLNYLGDLARLPGRQLEMWLSTLVRRPAIRAEFDPVAYPGRDLDRTRAIETIDGRRLSSYRIAPYAELEAARRKRTKDASRLAPPEAVRDASFHFSRFYLRRIERVVAAAEGRTAYVFLPAYRAGTIAPSMRRDLRLAAPVIDLGGAIADDHSKWLDATHVNAWGAMAQSRRFGAALVAMDPALGTPGCAFWRLPERE